MKKICKKFTLLLVCLMACGITGIFAQAPQKMSYQAIIRNATNALITNTTVGMQVSILQGSAAGTVVYQETHTLSTNANGLVSLVIGDGTVVSGTIVAISWGMDSYYIKTETDPAGGTACSITGTSQLLSVPYALFAGNAGNPPAGTLNYVSRFTPDGSTLGNSQIFDDGSNVAVNTNTPEASAQLEVSSTTKGFLPPRMTEAQRDAIASPVAGLIVWCSDCGPSGEVQVNNGTAWTNMVGGTASFHTPAIGESYKGGKVAYVLQSGDPGYDANVPHGIIVAPVSLYASAGWGCYNVLAGSNGVVLGTGAANTDIINTTCGVNSAGGTCYSYSITVNAVIYDDWFLPSSDELREVYNNRVTLGFVIVGTGRYWTSTEYNALYANYIDFTTGNLENGGAIGIYKNNNAQPLLPIRTF